MAFLGHKATTALDRFSAMAGQLTTLGTSVGAHSCVSFSSDGWYTWTIDGKVIQRWRSERAKKAAKAKRAKKKARRAA